MRRAAQHLCCRGCQQAAETDACLCSLGPSALLACGSPASANRMCSDGLRWTDSTSLKSCTHPGPPGARASCTPSADAAARLLRQGCCSGRSLFTDVGICSAASSTTEGASSRLEFGRSADATAGLTGEATNSISGQGQQQSEWQQEASQREARRQLLESALKHVVRCGAQTCSCLTLVEASDGQEAVMPLSEQLWCRRNKAGHLLQFKLLHVTWACHLQ